jgi:hypothetical protein
MKRLNKAGAIRRRKETKRRKTRRRKRMLMQTRMKRNRNWRSSLTQLR